MPASEIRVQKYTCVCVYSCIMVCAGRCLDCGRRQYVVPNWLNLIFDITTFTIRGSPLHLSFQYVLQLYSLLHLVCHLISISNLDLLGLFSTESGKRDIEN